MKKLLAILAVLAILSGALPPTLQQAAWTRLLPGRWMLLAGGGADIWDFQADGTCTGTGIAFDGGEITKAHTWRVEAATEADLQKLWAQPQMVLVIDGEVRYGLHLNYEEWQEAMGILSGGLITEEERALAADLPLCISITFGEGGGGYVRMKEQ